MSSPGGKLSGLIPRSIAARGLLLVGAVAAVVAVPGFIAHNLLMDHQLEVYGQQRDAFLSLALATQLENAPDPDTDHDKWLAALGPLVQRVRWAGVFDQAGKGLQFRRRTALPLKQIHAQIDFAAEEEQSRPLHIDGQASRRFDLLTVPLADGAGVFAVILDGGTVPNRQVAATLGMLALATLIGLCLALAWLQYGIQQPIERLTQQLANVQDGLAEAALDGMMPAELTGLVKTVEETRRELKKWRSEATYLRYSADAEVDARTQKAARAQRRAEHSADTDPLTRLGNRRLLERELPRLFDANRTAGGELSVVVIDVNNFKILNDSLGHQVGDELLVFAGELIGAAVRKGTDVAVRYGGDEFVLVLPGTTTHEALNVVKRLIALFNQRARTLNSVSAPPGLSAGVAGLRQHGSSTWEELLQHADAAMYHAKRSKLGVATVDQARSRPLN